ncbi:MAG: hypothetical protein E7613_06325 [Ruminococcaceae bacterium]|nr:hypothetical protein [Oscillospiraceae bacterium]
MSEYLIGVVTASLICTVIGSFVSDKGSGKTAKAVISIIMTAIIIIPITSSLENISENLAFPVINERNAHIDNTEDDIREYRGWLAGITATEMSKSIQGAIKENLGIDVRVVCPWHFEGDDVVFEKLKIYTGANERYFEKIETYVKLHYSFDCQCIKEVE